MAFPREFSRKRQAADQTNTPVEEMQNHFHTSQPEIPPKAYTYGEGWCFGSRSELLLRESRTSQSIDNPLTDTLGSYERLSTNIPASPDVCKLLVSKSDLIHLVTLFHRDLFVSRNEDIMKRL